MIRKLVAAMLLVGLIALWAYSDLLFPPETVSGPVIHVRDGDTFDMTGETIRLAGIDAPEYHQMCKDAGGADWPCGRAARAQLEALASGGRVTCAKLATDQYHRTVARCGTGATPDLGEAMVRAGLAISPALRGEAAYAEAEQSARDAKRGIWQGAYQSPADWRAAHLTSHP